MKLGKLIGYDTVTGQYTDGQGEVALLTKNPFTVVATTLPSDYDDVSDSMEYWHQYSQSYIGSLVGFKDWMCLRNQIKVLVYAIAGSDFATWDNLTQEQKVIAMRYIPTKIIDAKGSPFFMGQAGGLYEGKLYLDEFQVLAETARKKRLKTFGDFGYYGLGKNQGLQLERIYQVLALDKAYIERGIMYFSEDSVMGIGDWILGNEQFSINGLKPLLNNASFNLVAGFPYNIDQFCAILCTNILENGLY